MISTLILYTLILQTDAAVPCISFEKVTLDSSLPGAYQTAIADINNDGRPDIAALGESRVSGVYWYENPSWRKRPISGPEIQNCIDLAFYDINQDGNLELVLACDFGMSRTESGGAILWLERQENLDQPWVAHTIHAEPTSHRLRWVDANNDGQKELIVAPIMGPGSSAPDFMQSPIRLLSLSIPENPYGHPWPMQVIDESLHIAHGLYIEESNEDRTIFTASVEGIVEFTPSEEDRLLWVKNNLCSGAPASEGRTGCSEVTVGRFKDGSRFLTTIEPWHGNQVVVYRLDADDVQATRHVIDDSFDNGHALACGDFDGDGDDEIIAGYRGKGHSIYLYNYMENEEKPWQRCLLDIEVAAQGFAVEDVNQDGLLDFVATGGSTQNVRLYINQGVTN